jgi:nicotinamidase-related amidase
VALRFDPTKSALIIQDLQNDVIMPGGAFTKPDAAPAEHAKKQNVVGNVKALAAAARSAGMPVVHVWYIVEKGAVGLKQNAPLFQAVKATNGLVRGSRGAAPVKGLEAKRGDHVVEKTRMNAFHGTKLDNLLRGLGTETVVITGAWTNFSIEHTARHAADAGYNAVVVTDGTSTINDEWQHAALNYALTNIAERASTADVLAVLERRSGRKPAAKRKAPARR